MHRYWDTLFYLLKLVTGCTEDQISIILICTCILEVLSKLLYSRIAKWLIITNSTVLFAMISNYDVILTNPLL